jgi:hypothetical protein
MIFVMPLTDEERRHLTRFLLNHTASLAERQTKGRITETTNPFFGKVMEDGEDVTLQLLEDERTAHVILGKLQ